MLALSQDVQQNRPVEAREHIRRFHELFFSLSPDKSAIESNVQRALYLSDESAIGYYRNLQEKGYFNRMIAGNISQTLTVDSIRGNFDSYPYRMKAYYQLMAWKKKKPEQLEKAETLLMIPDYLNFLLSGVKAQEYTNATTTQLVNPETGDWNREMIQKLGYPEKIFLPIREPGTVIGRLKKEIQEQVGFDCEIVLPATHDTGSAVVAVPSNEEHVLYISSGTWSLMGTELKEADCGTEAMQHNFTNEGGYNRRYRFLKNIMGLWMIQSVRKEIAEEVSFGTICEMASKCRISSIVDANDDRFLAPEHMTVEVQKACEESGQQIPQGITEIAAVIYNSLAVCYAKTLKELEEQTGCQYRKIHVVGGGANADYLNRLTAEKTGRTVLAGPTEATAIGNLAVQMITGKECSNLKDARNCIFHSFEIKQYEP